MVDWRTLGEVPDSEDDDDFDNDSVEKTGTVSNTIAKGTHDDIWDVPSSQPQAGRSQTRDAEVATKFEDDSWEALPEASMRQIDETEAKDIWEVPSSAEVETRHPIESVQRRTQSMIPPPATRQQTSESRLPSHQTSSQDLPPIEKLMADDLSHESHTQRFSRENQDAQLPSKANGSTSPSNPDLALAGHSRTTRQLDQTLLQSQILGHDIEQERAGLLAARYERSLRARKPVQLFPFAMEEADYRRYCKESGYRPMKMRNVHKDSDRRRRERADSEEEDFEPESQGSHVGVENSQPNGADDLDDDLGILAAPSSPMQTSPLDTRGGPSSQASSKGETDNTSPDDDELPSIQQLVSRKRQKKKHKQRRPSSDKPSSLKRRRMRVSLDSSPIPKGARRFSIRQDSPDPLGSSDQPHHSVNHEHHESKQTSEPPSADETRPTEHQAEVSRRPVSDGDSEEDEQEPQRTAISDDDTCASSDSGSEVVNKNRGRIRGVLPASWLRIDQQTGRTQLENKLQKKLHHSPDREMRRGVAQRRQADSNVFHDNLLFSESEEDAPPKVDQPTTDDHFRNQTRLALQPLPLSNPPAIELLSDDDGQVIEEDYIDRMASGRKRQMKLSEAFAKPAKRTKTSRRATTASVSKKSRQPKISNALDKRNVPPAARSNPSKKRKARTRREDSTLAPGFTRNTGPKAPLLSVLDVIQPQAPHFLRIAARTARSRREQGRASPTKKVIRLATRQDHVDAAEVLDNWKRGTIKQRDTVTVAKRSRRAPEPRPARPASSTTQSFAEAQPSLFSTANPRQLVQQPSNAGRVRYKSLSTRPIHSSRPSDQQVNSTFQPAELQTEAASFQMGMRFLDQMYRQGKRGTPTVSGIVPPGRVTRKKHKNTRPQQIDTNAPHYSHANDPLPFAQPALPDPVTDGQRSDGAKLRGLGPFGTSYTHHFEVFPLAPGIYFHSSTLLGTGALEVILHTDYEQRLQGAKPNAVLTLGQRTLRWGPWGALVSSEMGVVVDHVCEQLGRPSDQSDPNTPTSVSAADHLLAYVKDCITFDSAADVGQFLERSVEVVQGFIEHLTAHPTLTSPDLFRVCDRLALFTFTALRICSSDHALLGPKMRLESLIKSLGVVTAKLLACTSVHELRQTYRRLQSIRAGERGIREDDYAIHTWTLLLRIFENARIPRSGFWDVVQESFLPPDLASSTDVSHQESAWEGFFTLLPLTDFTDSGVLMAGGRQRCTTDGWLMAQKLLKRVFEIYQGNPRQPQGFNSYCKALISRCHYLVQHWGWRKSSGVVGIIFDFFGSRGLAHLRHEEVYGSPRFLEDLPRTPTLQVEPGDRCFHVFLKLLASSIKQLREDGSTRDVRNLVTRTLPNHSRLYAKEQDIPESELAALRNHHDLLVTLFWAAPPDLRPSVDLLERLVVPASSHKEACLINLRAWNQLARFIISAGITDEHGEAQTSFNPFYQWRANFFGQTMQQLDTVASDIQKQLVSLSTSVSKTISSEMVDAMVSMNKSGIMDIIRLSMAASLDVMKHAPDLQSASYAFSTSQLQRVFDSFAISPPEMDWGILRIALATLNSFLSRIDEFEAAQESQQSESQLLNAALGDDALLVLDENVASSYFKMARCVLASSVVRDTSARDAMDRFDCIEQATMLGARLSVKLIGAGVMALTDLFTQGKYRLFAHFPDEQGLGQRKFLTLFVTTLLKHDFDDFSKAGLTLEELYMLSIVKPRESLVYENRLAEQLIRHGKSFAREPATGFAISPDYGTNCQLFKFAITHMHKLVRDAGPSVKKDLIAEHTRILRLVMAQIRGDLQAIVDDGTQHRPYVAFVQRIMALIKTYGPSSCAVDDFFLQVRREYWPDKKDPQLRVANMAAYGLRVMEGDSRVESQLFWLMFSRFKFAMMGDQLEEETEILAAGLREPGIVKFVMGCMLPAVIEATAQVSAEVLLGVYAQALDMFLDCDDACFVLEEDCLPQIQAILVSILRSLRTQETGHMPLANNELHVLRLLVGIMNLLWPSIYMFLMNEASCQVLGELKSILGEIMQIAEHIELCLGRTSLDAESVFSRSDLLGFAPLEGHDYEPNPSVSSLADLIVGDVRKTWQISAQRVNVPAHPQPTQSTQPAPGVERPVFERGALIGDLYVRMKEWNRWWKKAFGAADSARGSYEELLLI